MSDQIIVDQTCAEAITTTTRTTHTSLHQQEVGLQTACGEIILGIRTVNAGLTLDAARIRLSAEQARELAQRLLEASDQVDHGHGPAT